MQVSRCLDPGMSILVASADARNVPSCCRGIALTSTDGLKTVTVYMPVATSHAVLQNIATTRRVAITTSHPIDHVSVQLKGASAGVRLAGDEDAPLMHARLAAFVDALEQVGVPRRVVENVSCWPAFAVTLRVEQMFEQTPGPNAGTRLP